MNDLLPSASISVRNSPQDFMNQMADIAEQSKNFKVERRFDYELMLNLDIVDFFPQFHVPHQEFLGQLIYIPKYKQKVAVEVRANRWAADQLTYDVYVSALHTIFNSLLRQYNKTFQQRYRLSVKSKEDLEPTLPPNANSAFTAFARLANRGSLHPLDWDRFYRFVYVCHATHVNPSQDNLVRLLVKERFDEEYAERIASIFGHLIDFARLR